MKDSAGIIVPCTDVHGLLSVIDQVLRHTLGRKGKSGTLVLRVVRGDSGFVRMVLQPLAGHVLASRPDVIRLSVTEETSERIRNSFALMRALLEVLLDWDRDFGRRFSAKQVCSGLWTMLGWTSGDFVRFAKYSLAWPLARHLRQHTMPERPSGFFGTPFLFRGPVARYLKKRLVSRSDKNFRLFHAWLQAKRGTAVVSPAFVREQLLKHRAALSRPEAPETAENWFLAEFTAKVDAVWRATRRFERAPEAYEASSNASFSSSRKRGGQREEVLRAGVVEDSDLLWMGEVSGGRVEEIRGFPFSRSNLSRSIETPLSVRVATVLEPLKVRTVTAGEALPYYRALYYQKLLHSGLRHLQQFALIGRPLNVSDLLWLHEVSSRDFDHWNSGDYSAATDNLKVTYSLLVLERWLALRQVPVEDQKLLLSVLGPQIVNYPDPEIPPLLMERGQLMGSPLSFPVLCVVNLATYWVALERRLGQSVSLRDLPVLVNGDDILFRSDVRLFAVWRSLLRYPGFELSLGKNYLHPSYCIINSEAWRVDQARVCPLPYLNVGLLTGQAKLSGRRNDRTIPSWFWWERIWPGCIDQARAWRRYCHYHRETLEGVTRGGRFQLFAARELGGLGLTRPPLDIRVTRFQRALAAALRREISSKRWTRLPRWLGYVSKEVTTGTVVYPRDRWLALVPAQSPNRSNERDITEKVVRIPMSGKARSDWEERWVGPKTRLDRSARWPLGSPFGHFRVVEVEPVLEPVMYRSYGWWDQAMLIEGQIERFYFI